jgi:DNA-binding protein HU-beta
MTKAELVGLIAKRTGIERQVVLTAVEAFMEEVKVSLEKGEPVHLRGFIIPEHDVPAFKPADTFVDKVRNRSKTGA